MSYQLGHDFEAWPKRESLTHANVSQGANTVTERRTTLYDLPAFDVACFLVVVPMYNLNSKTCNKTMEGYWCTGYSKKG